MKNAKTIGVPINTRTKMNKRTSQASGACGTLPVQWTGPTFSGWTANVYTKNSRLPQDQDPGPGPGPVVVNNKYKNQHTEVMPQRIGNLTTALRGQRVNYITRF